MSTGGTNWNPMRPKKGLVRRELERGIQKVRTTTPIGVPKFTLSSQTGRIRNIITYATKKKSVDPKEKSIKASLRQINRQADKERLSHTEPMYN